MVYGLKDRGDYIEVRAHFEDDNGNTGTFMDAVFPGDSPRAYLGPGLSTYEEIRERAHTYACVVIEHPPTSETGNCSHSIPAS